MLHDLHNWTCSRLSVPKLMGQSEQPPSEQLSLPYLLMTAHHDVRSSDVFIRRLHGTLAAAAEQGPKDFPDLLLMPGV
jgi:hypothetical protein